MSGHSKWSTIKHQKAANDKARGQLFSKLVKAITIAAKTGGGPDPETNHKLKAAIDAAKSANMPKDNIKRAIESAEKSTASLEEIVYEGFGPEGVGVIVETTTDNRNRTAQEIKYLFERGGGSMGGPGSVSFNFESKGYLVINTDQNLDDVMLTLIDHDMDDLEKLSDNKIEAYVSPQDLYSKKKELEDAGFNVIKTEFVKEPKSEIAITDSSIAKKIVNLLQSLEEHDDVQKVYTNADIIAQYE